MLPQAEFGLDRGVVILKIIAVFLIYINKTSGYIDIARIRS